MNSLVTTVYALDEDEKTFGIHSKCHMLFAPEEEEPEKSFTDLLDSFFTTHNTIKENLKQLGNGMPDMEKKERVRINTSVSLLSLFNFAATFVPAATPPITNTFIAHTFFSQICVTTLMHGQRSQYTDLI